MANDLPTLVVGRIPFLVCAPYFHRALSAPPLQGVTYLDGTPSQHNQQLSQGLIHLAPSSSYAYALHPESYWIMPDFCTGSTLEIRSVKLFSKFPIQDLTERKIHLTPQSATSVHLLKLILRSRFRLEPTWSEGAYAPETCDARLLIGDQALAETKLGHWPFQYDLATLWQEWHDLPFTFGLWIVHRSAVEDARLYGLLQDYRVELQDSVATFQADIPGALEAWQRVYPSQLTLADLLPYYAIVDYRFTPDHKASLELFYRLCAAEGLLAKAPALRFLGA